MVDLGEPQIVDNERRLVDGELLNARAVRGGFEPAATINASRSSISRALAYGCVSPLSPRPRRS
jgi:hypothetical protein